MIDMVTGRPLTPAEIGQTTGPHDMYPMGGIMTTMVVPLIAEFRAEAQLAGSKKYKGFFGGPVVEGAEFSKRDIKNLALGGGGIDQNLRHSQNVHGPNHPRYTGQSRSVGVTPGQLNQLRYASLLKAGAFTIGMGELIKVGASMAGAGIDAVMSYRSAPKEVKLKSGPGFFHDTRAAQTQRQRAIQAIHNSQMTTRAALGNEAAFLHI